MDRPGLHAGYTAVLRDFRLEFSRGGAYTGIVLILLGMGLDSALYPDMQRSFTGARVLVAALIFCVALAMRTRWAQERIAWMTFAWLLLPPAPVSRSVSHQLATQLPVARFLVEPDREKCARQRQVVDFGQ